MSVLPHRLVENPDVGVDIVGAQLWPTANVNGGVVGQVEKSVRNSSHR